MSRIFSLSVPVLFSLAAVDFLLRMDFVMLVLVLSLSLFFHFVAGLKGIGVKGRGLLWLSSSDGYK